MKKFKLTRKEFVNMTEDGAVFEYYGAIYFFDDSKTNPYRFKANGQDYTNGIDLSWGNFNGENEFTLIEPEPVIERRWIWLNDIMIDGATSTSTYYVSDKYAEDKKYKQQGWYKSETYVDVEVR